MDEDQIREIIRDEIDKLRVHQSMIIPGAVTDQHLGLGERTAGDMLYIDSELRLKLFNAGIPNSGWAVTNKTEDKTLDCNVNDTLVTSDVLGTLIDTLISMGVLSA